MDNTLANENGILNEAVITSDEHKNDKAKNTVSKTSFDIEYEAPLVERISSMFSAIENNRHKIKTLVADMTAATTEVYRLLDSFAKEKKALTERQMKAVSRLALLNRKQSGSLQTILEDTSSHKRLELVFQELMQLDKTPDYVLVYHELKTIENSQQLAISELSTILNTANTCQAILSPKLKAISLYRDWYKSINTALTRWLLLIRGIITSLHAVHGMTLEPWITGKRVPLTA